jgi:hypothetical protein
VPFELALCFEALALGRELAFDCDLAFGCERAFGELDFARALPFAPFVDRLDAPFAFGADPLDDPLPAFLRGLLEVDLLVAIS